MHLDDIHHGADGSPRVEALALDGLVAAMQNDGDDANFQHRIIPPLHRSAMRYKTMPDHPMHRSAVHYTARPGSFDVLLSSKYFKIEGKIFPRHLA